MEYIMIKMEKKKKVNRKVKNKVSSGVLNI